MILVPFGGLIPKTSRGIVGLRAIPVNWIVVESFISFNDLGLHRHTVGIDPKIGAFVRIRSLGR